MARVAVVAGWIAACAVLSAGARAQAPSVAPQAGAQAQTQAPPPSGTVTGQVIAQDTQVPARFAQVMLQGVSPASGGEVGSGASGTNRVIGGGFVGALGGSVMTTTGVDGTFTAVDVAPGDYYVMASAPGYIPERALLTAEVAAGADPADLLARIPMVHVGADSVSSVTVTIERGGTLAGKVVWEDGSPVAGVSINATLTGVATTLPAVLQAIRSPGAPAFTTTDDRGGFRLSGLPTGEYLVQVMLQDRPQFGQFGGFPRGVRMGSTLRIYSPGVFRKTEAKPVSVEAGVERDDLRMVINLHGLHTVSGQAGSVASGLSVESGRVTLVDSSDNSLMLAGSIDDHGDFSIAYVPPGNYTLRVFGASTRPEGAYRGRDSQQTPATSFQQFSEPVVVSDADVSGISAMLTPAQSSQ